MAARRKPMEHWEAFHNCTASKMALAFECHAWVWERYKRDTNDAAELGTLYHDMVSSGKCQHKDDHLVYLAQELYLIQPVEFAEYRNEIAFAWSPSETYEVPVVNREYPHTNHLFGTIDLVSACATGDLKTGEHSESHLVQVEVASAVLDKPECRLYYVKFNENLNVEVVEKSWPLEPVARNVVLAKMGRLHRLIMSETEATPSEPVPGEHCEKMWCPRRKTCPASPVYKGGEDDDE